MKEINREIVYLGNREGIGVNITDRNLYRVRVQGELLNDGKYKNVGKVK